ncbi:hypothetical protein FHW89_003255 [Mucilaginibacter sp. SG564]|nr:hypothetical protein [Mucilaginibacter sp. SG564]
MVKPPAIDPWLQNFHRIILLSIFLRIVQVGIHDVLENKDHPDSI